MNKAKVNVIVTCYNSERYLVETLESVFAQNFTNFSLTAIDDGSTDQTASILKNCNSKVTVLRHKDRCNHGQSASLNLGISRCDSEYIAFLDHDDTWHPDKLKRQVEVLDLCPEVGLVYTNGFVINGENRVLYPLLPVGHMEIGKAVDLLLDCYIRTPSMVMVRAKLLKKVGSFVEGIIADQDMWLRIKEVSNFHYLNEKLTSYREHSGQISSASRIRMWHDALLVLDRALQRYPYPAWSRRKRLAVIKFRLGIGYWMMRAYPTALTHFLNSFSNDPIRAIRYAVQKGFR